MAASIPTPRDPAAADRVAGRRPGRLIVDAPSSRCGRVPEVVPDPAPRHRRRSGRSPRSCSSRLARGHLSPARCLQSQGPVTGPSQVGPALPLPPARHGRSRSGQGSAGPRVRRPVRVRLRLRRGCLQPVRTRCRRRVASATLVPPGRLRLPHRGTGDTWGSRRRGPASAGRRSGGLGSGTATAGATGWRGQRLLRVPVAVPVDRAGGGRRPPRERPDRRPDDRRPARRHPPRRRHGDRRRPFRAPLRSSLSGSSWLFTRANGIVDMHRWIPWVSRKRRFERPNHGDPFVTPVSPLVTVRIRTDVPLAFGNTGGLVATTADGLTKTFRATNVRDFVFTAATDYPLAQAPGRRHRGPRALPARLPGGGDPGRGRGRASHARGPARSLPLPELQGRPVGRRLRHGGAGRRLDPDRDAVGQPDATSSPTRSPTSGSTASSATTRPAQPFADEAAADFVAR